MSASPQTSQRALMLGALGVVFGDIGTSPLYTMKEVFGGHGLALTQANVLGVLSLVFWALLIVVSAKYVGIMLRADNKGEGGIMALLTLTQRYAPLESTIRRVLMILGLFGAALFFGDSVITPAISVLSAVEGLELAAPWLHQAVVPVALGILIGLFFIQRRGTGHIGRWFGPIMLLWFGVMGLLGLLAILDHPQVLNALDPLYAIRFMGRHGLAGFLLLGAVVLAITGAEALYADMGHFGRLPIQRIWFGYVLPALVLNYFGQGALLLADHAAVRNPFYLLAPGWALYPMIALATAATIIASQAVISGAFSVTRQIIQMGYAPRLSVLHTSAQEIGQIYIPFVNWALLCCTLLLVLGFKTSSNLAAAYGIAVTATFAIDTLLVFIFMRLYWNLHLGLTLLGVLAFLTVDLSFFAANSVKIPDGGWFPLLMATLVFTLLTTWKWGRALLARRLQEDSIPVEALIDRLQAQPPIRVPGTAIFMTASTRATPHALLHNLKHNSVLHERVVLLTVDVRDVPYVPDDQRMETRDLGFGFHRILLHYGFKDEIDIPLALTGCPCGRALDPNEFTYFFSRETLLPVRQHGLGLWRGQLFATLARSAVSPMRYFRIPRDRVVELGSQVEI